ncbi:MAG: hypothetical protein KAR06_08765 [Deltaproteobacteria bacterium]|nr:hypothetical protein [Deltaproteobacteria bacterium]
MKGTKLYKGLDKTTKHVINSLVDIKGDTPEEVVAFMLRSWIGDHQPELGFYSIDIYRNPMTKKVKP